jgi:hypothetical protein
LARLFFFVVNGYLLQILSFKDLVAVLASQVIDPVTAHQKFRALVLATRHTQIILILRKVFALSSLLFA